MHTSDKKIIELIEILKSLNIIRFKREFYSSIGFLEQNYVKILQGKAHFTTEHLEKVCKVYNINANWIFGTSENVFR